MRAPAARTLLRAAALAAAAAGAATAQTATEDTAEAPPEAPTETPIQAAFRDDFSRLDEARWYVSDGWSNGDWMACTWSRRMIGLADGALTISLAPTEAGSSDYLCGELQSNDLFHYGTYEASIRTDVGSGVNAAFFTYIGPVHDQPHDEIDFEILTRNTRAVDVNTYNDGESAQGTSVALDVPTDSAFRTYSFVWEPERLRWFVDGELVHEATGPDLPDAPQKIFLSHWNSRTFTDWMGPFEDPGRPLTMAVDWVAFTPLGDGCRFEGSVLCVPGVEG